MKKYHIYNSNLILTINLCISYYCKMTKVLFGIFICLVFFKLEVKSQENNSWTIYPAQKEAPKEKAKTNNKKKVKGSNITTIEDDRIGNLLEKENEINKSKGTMKGFRVQIYYGSGAESRTLARKVQSDFIKQFPNQPSYLIFQSPNFKIRVGDFRTKLEAEKFMLEVKEYFENAFIVKDEIALPELK